MSITDRFANLVRPFQFIWLSIRLHYAALVEAVRRDGLGALLHLQSIRDAAAAKLLIITCKYIVAQLIASSLTPLIAACGFIAHEDTTSVPSLVKAAEGKILELGPGPGNQIHRFDPSLVDLIYAIDPNPGFRNNLEAKVNKSELKDKYKLLTCGIEDSQVLREAGVTEGSLDTVLSIQVLCAVGDTKSVMREVWKLLKPGGKFIFWEHGRSADSLTAIAQVCYEPAWSTFIGCHVNRDIKKAILDAGEWENPQEIEQPNDPYGFLPRAWGVLVKKA